MASGTGMCTSLVLWTEQSLGLLIGLAPLVGGTGLGLIQISKVLPPGTHEGTHSRDETL